MSNINTTRGSLFETNLVLENPKYKLKCLAMYNSAIFAGCSDNALRIFIAPGDSLSSASASYKRNSYRCVYEDRKFYNKKILQFCIIEYFQLFIALIDDTVYFYHIQCNSDFKNMNSNNIGNFQITLNKLFELEECKGCNVVAFSKSWRHDPQQTLAIAFGTKRHVLLYKWTKEDINNLENKSILSSKGGASYPWKSMLKKKLSFLVPEKPRCLIFAQKNIVVGYKSEYNLVSLHDTSIKVLFQTGSSKKALGIPLTDEEILLIKDKEGIIINYTGQPTRHKGIDWSSVPEQLFFEYPYIVSVQAKVIEVHHCHTHNLLKQIDFPSGKWAEAVCYQSLNDNIWRSYGCVASETHLLSMHLCTLKEQFDDLVKPPEKNFYEEGLYLCEKIHDQQFKEENIDRGAMIRKIKEYFAYYQFNTYSFQEAVENFEESRISARRVISLFPSMLPAGQCKFARTQHPVDPLNLSKNDKNLKKAIRDFLIPYLGRIRSQIIHNNWTDEYGLTERTNIENDEWPLIELIDTMYLKCLLQVSQESIPAFLKDKNSCNIPECETELLKHKKYLDLVYLYKSHDRHVKALEILENYASVIDGMELTIEYLQELGKNPQHQSLVLQYATWVLKANPDQGLRIFTGKSFTEAHSSQRHQGGLPPSPVNNISLIHISPTTILTHLETTSKVDIPTRIAYLDFLIYERGEQASLFHDEYIKLHLQEIQKALQKEEKIAIENRNKYGFAKNDFVELRDDFIFQNQIVATKGTLGIVRDAKNDIFDRPVVDVAFLDLSRSCDVPKLLLQPSAKKRRIPPELQGGHVGVLRRKLIEFLRTSKYYNSKVMLRTLEEHFPNMLLEEQVWIRARIPEHGKALETIIYGLDDSSMAEVYCDTVWTQLENHIMTEANLIMHDKFILDLPRSNNINNIIGYDGIENKERSPDIPSYAQSKLNGKMKMDQVDGGIDHQNSILNERIQNLNPTVKRMALNRLLVNYEDEVAYRIYETLLAVYLSRKPLDMKKLTEGLQILIKYHDRTNAEAIIAKLPDEVSVKYCKLYLTAVVKASSEKQRDNQVINNLFKQTQLQLQLKKIKIESDYQWITDETVCKSCGKLIGQAAFLRYPNGNVYHFICVRTKHVDPLTMKRFSADDV